MRIAVFGVGAVGGYFGGRLLAAGEDVVFIARGETLRALNAHGLRMENLDGSSSVLPAKAFGDPQEAGPVDAVILGVKAWQVADAATSLRPLIGPDTFVVPLENGVEAPSQLAAELGPHHVFGGLCYVACVAEGPGHIRHAGMEPRVLFGELDNRRTERAEQLLAHFVRAGVRAEIPPDIHAAMWEKFLFIASLSGVAAVSRAPAGVVRSIPETRLLLEKVAEEIEAVARGRGIALKSGAAAATMRVIDGLPPNTTTSMQRDIMEGCPSELSAQSGAVVRLGEAVGQPAPLNAYIYASLLPQELKARGQERL